MATKKLLLTMALFVLAQTFVQSQSNNWGWDWKDSSKVSVKDRPQYSEFLNNSFPYPAKPRDQWEIGIGAGLGLLGSDLVGKAGLTASITARKSVSHVFSFRPYLTYYNVSGGGVSYANDFKTSAFHLGTDFVASLNTVRSYKGNPKTAFHLLTGAGLIMANVKQLVGGNYVSYYPITTGGLITTFGDKNSKGIGKTTLGLGFNIGGGAAFKINDNSNLGLEVKVTITNYDYYDGASTVFSNSYDVFTGLTAKYNFNVGNKASKVQPLWWINPNNYVYNELNAPQHMKQKTPVLPDADGDGIPDQFDLEPNTPAGAQVDSRGRAVDTDGDGIPDYKDKEKLTSQKCFPVNNEGVGSCPPDACCKENSEKVKQLEEFVEKVKSSGFNPGSGTTGGDCSVGNLPSIVFKSGGSKLSRDNMKLLDAVAEQLKNNAGCRLKVVGHPKASSKSEQQKSYDRVEAIIKYLVEKQNIAENRFIFAYDGGDGDSNTIDLQATTETGPNTVPAPHPQLKGKQNY